MYLFLGVIFLILLIFMAAIVVFTMIKAAKNKGEPITKANLFYLAPAFLLDYFLYVIGAVYAGEKFDFFYCFSLIGDTLDVFKFGLNSSLILPLCKAEPIFYADFILACLLSGVTVILSIASFFGKRIGNFFRARSRLRKNTDIVIGDSADAIKYAENTEGCVVLGVSITGRRYADLLKSGVTVVRTELRAATLVKKLKKGEHHIIVFRDGNFSHTQIIEIFSAILEGGGKAYLHLEANQDEMKVIKEKFISKAENGVGAYISSFSKYELLARKFVSEHPVTKYIPRSFYNDNYSLKENKKINVVFVGFGRVNYQLFRMCAMQFQFAGQNGNKLVSEPVNYYVYDSEEKRLYNEFFSRIEYEFDEEFKDCDFAKPDKICNLNVSQTDINSSRAKKEFRELVTENSFTYFIISLENDLEDASYARTVKRLLCDESNYRIFVRAKNNNGEKLNSENDSIIYFGEEKKLFTHDCIVNDDLTELSMRINLMYSNMTNPPEWLIKIKELPAKEQNAALIEKLKDPENMKLMLGMWAKLPFIEQSSNLYHALNLPFKLNLLGFDMVKADSGEKGVSEAEFNERYVNSGKTNGYSDYGFFFGAESSNVLAFTEHQRWNALYILYDYKQMKKADMKVEDGKVAHKDIAKKRHACITTYYGLDELIKFKYGLLNPDADMRKLDYKTDETLRALGKIYAYDYMDLDRLYAEITAMGFKLIEK